MKKRVLIGAALLCAAAALAPGEAPSELAKDPAFRFLQEKVRADPLDFIAQNKLAGKYLEHLRLSGDLRSLEAAARAAEASLKAAPPEFNAGGLSLRGRVEMAQHRFSAAGETALEWQEVQPGKTGAWLLLGDALLELGDYPGAEKAFAEVVRIDGLIMLSSQPRLARLDMIRGRLKEAGAGLDSAWWMAESARDQPGGAEILAWCAVQRGELAFRQGQWELAEHWYQAANWALPGWYVVDDHFAELRAAQGRFDEAVAIYEKVIARVPRPELFQALGDVLVFAGRPEPAKPWFAKARELYTASFAKGELLYLHHGSGFFADSVSEPETAVAWARKDLEYRQSVHAWDALAWAEYKAGRVKEAAAAIDKALAPGVKDAHILYHGSMIRMSAGDLAGGKEALRQAVAVNPRYNTFHAHR